MSWSRSLLTVEGYGNRTVVSTARATAPQRWTVVQRSRAAWAEAYHQLIGDGAFAGDRVGTAIRASDGARCVVRSVAATPIRKGASTSVTRIRANGATVVYLPGALVPHAGANHTAALRIDARDGGRVLAFSLLTPGRSARDERLQFGRLRLRTTALVDGREVFAEDASAEGGPGFDGPGGFAGAGVFVSALVVGKWAPACASWWHETEPPTSLIGGTSQLAPGLLVYRGLCATLGDALEFANGTVQRIKDGFPKRDTRCRDLREPSDDSPRS